jgi:hypothetical protein
MALKLGLSGPSGHSGAANRPRRDDGVAIRVFFG